MHVHPTAAEVQVWFDVDTQRPYEDSVEALYHFIDCMNAYTPGVGFSVSNDEVGEETPLYDGKVFYQKTP